MSAGIKELPVFSSEKTQAYVFLFHVQGTLAIFLDPKTLYSIAKSVRAVHVLVSSIWSVWYTQTIIVPPDVEDINL